MHITPMDGAAFPRWSVTSYSNTHAHVPLGLLQPLPAHAKFLHVILSINYM